MSQQAVFSFKIPHFLTCSFKLFSTKGFIDEAFSCYWNVRITCVTSISECVYIYQFLKAGLLYKKKKRHAPMTHEQKRHLQNKTGKSLKLKTCM